MVSALRAFCKTMLLPAAMSGAAAQSLPPVRQLGPVLSTSVEPMAAVSQVRALAGGRVIVHDNGGRRVLMFDSTLTTFTVIADTTSATAHAYASDIGGLVAARADSTIFADPVLLSMFMIDPNGKVVRTMAAPQPNEAHYLIGGPFGTPGIDPQGRLVYRARVGGPTKIISPPRPGQPPAPDVPDSAMVVRFNLATRKADTVAHFVVPNLNINLARDENGHRTITTTVNPIPWTDDWALLSDGTVAIVHGQDYRVDFFGADGKMAPTQKLAFDWQRLTDADKSMIVDSARKAVATQDSIQRAKDFPNDSGKPVPRPRPIPEGTMSNAAPGTSAPARAGSSTRVTAFSALNEMPDYRPPFRQAAARGDADGNLWIRTSKMVNDGAVYDVINKNGVLVDRIQVPPGRVIAGFGPGGVVYMGVLDGAIARLERARVVPRAQP